MNSVTLDVNSIFLFSVLEKKRLTMTLLILDRFWNSSNIETTLVKIPLVLNTEKQEAFCLYYDNNSLLQLMVVFIILKFLFSAFMQMRQY